MPDKEESPEEKQVILADDDGKLGLRCYFAAARAAATASAASIYAYIPRPVDAAGAPRHLEKVAVRSTN